MIALEPYHWAWLEKHPERSEEWLRSMLMEGFHIHHVDHDHSNNAGGNLVLIDGMDHFGLHGRNLRTEVIEGRRAKYVNRVELGRIAYERKSPAESWTTIGRELWPESAQPHALARMAARAYARQVGAAFPKPNSAAPTYGRRAA